MELDSLKDIWKNLDENDLRPGKEVPILSMLQKKSQGSIAKLKRNLNRELIAVVAIYSLTIAYYITAWQGRYWEIAVLLFVVGLSFIVYYYYKNKLLKQMQCVACEVKSNLSRQLVTLEKYVRFYFIAGTLLTPLMYFVAGFIILFNAPGVTSPTDYAVDPTVSVGQLRLPPHFASQRFLLVFVSVGIALTVGIYFLNRWYINKLYGQHIQKLKELLAQMEETEE